MITAYHISKLIKEIDPKVDLLIESHIQPLFIESMSRSIDINPNCILDHSSGWATHFPVMTRQHFIDQMKLRGFNVVYMCDDRPCAEPYFRISMPPQEE